MPEIEMETETHVKILVQNPVRICVDVCVYAV